MGKTHTYIGFPPNNQTNASKTYAGNQWSISLFIVFLKTEAVTVPSGYHWISENGCFRMYTNDRFMKRDHVIGFRWPGTIEECVKKNYLVSVEVQYVPVTQLYNWISLDLFVPIFQADTNIKLITISTGTISAILCGSHNIVLNKPLPAAAIIPWWRNCTIRINLFNLILIYLLVRSNCRPNLSTAHEYN